MNIRFMPLANFLHHSTRSTCSTRLKPFRVFSVFRGSNHNTLSPRGVCSRITHPRQICRAPHVQISTHVYLLHIIPFLGCLRLSVVVVSIDSHSENRVSRSARRYAFIRSHRPHAASNKYSPFLKVVLVCVPIKFAYRLVAIYAIYLSEHQLQYAHMALGMVALSSQSPALRLKVSLRK